MSRLEPWRYLLDSLLHSKLNFGNFKGALIQCFLNGGLFATGRGDCVQQFNFNVQLIKKMYFNN